MRTKLVVLTLALPLGSAVMLSAARAEEYRGTWEQQMACTPDVWRLCSAQIPDVNNIVACLRSNTPLLSSGCRAVFEANNANRAPTDTARAAPQAQPRARTAPPARSQAAPPSSNPWYDD